MFAAAAVKSRRGHSLSLYNIMDDCCCSCLLAVKGGEKRLKEIPRQPHGLSAR